MNWKKFLIGTAVIAGATVLALPVASACFMASAGAVVLGAQGAVLGVAGLSEWALYKSATKKAPKVMATEEEFVNAAMVPPKMPGQGGKMKINNREERSNARGSRVPKLHMPFVRRKMSQKVEEL